MATRALTSINVLSGGALVLAGCIMLGSDPEWVRPS